MKKRELTNREKEVLEQLLNGLSNKEIAQKLYISENTVKAHLNNIFDKYEIYGHARRTKFLLKFYEEYKFLLSQNKELLKQNKSLQRENLELRFLLDKK